MLPLLLSTLFSPLLRSRLLAHARIDKLQLPHPLALGADGARAGLARHNVNLVRLACLCCSFHGLRDGLDLLLLGHFRVLCHEVGLLLGVAEFCDGSLALARTGLGNLFDLLGACTLKIALDLG